MEESYEKIKLIGEGTYGQVYKARDRATGELVALKKVRMDGEKEGFPLMALREIKLLKKLNHKNVVKLKEVVTSNETGDAAGEEIDRAGNPVVAVPRRPGGVPRTAEKPIYMVFEYLENDLVGLMQDSGEADRGGRREFTGPQIKYYMYQLLEGLAYCHRSNVLHRDLKGSNLLLDRNGCLKIGDFGMARKFTPAKNAGQKADTTYTNRVVTLWYRPPELLLGVNVYGPAVDMWSAGCIIAELLNHSAILPGKVEADQLERIWDLLGTPTAKSWPNHERLPLWNTMRPRNQRTSQFRYRFAHFPKDGLDLVENLLQLDPAKRFTAEEALDHPYFWTDSFMGGKNFDPATLPRYAECHELEMKLKRQQQRAAAAGGGGGGGGGGEVKVEQ